MDMEIKSVKTMAEGMEDISPVLVPVDELSDSYVYGHVNGMDDVAIQFMIMGDDVWLPLLKDIAVEYGITPEALVQHLETVEYPYKLVSLKERFEECPGLLKDMYLLTNTDQFYGAGALANDYVKDKLYKIFGCNIIVIPTSIHEVLVLPENRYSEEYADTLLEMLYTLQPRTKDGEHDDTWLSDHIYYVDLQHGGARILQG